MNVQMNGIQNYRGHQTDSMREKKIGYSNFTEKNIIFKQLLHKTRERYNITTKG